MLVKTVTTKQHANKDVYNPSIPFAYNGKRYVLGRIESRDSEKDTISAFFKETRTGSWRLMPQASTYNLQDPFITKIKDTYIMGGVRVDWNSDGVTNTYRTQFYCGKSPFELQPFICGPERMKGIRCVGLEGDKIGVFTRPQGNEYGLGKIGFTVMDALEDLSEEVIVRAPLLSDQFGEKVWGGVNHAYYLGNGLVGVIGHRAWFTDYGRRYEAISFELNANTRECTSMRTIAQRSNFPKYAPKRPDLEDVIYPSGCYFKNKKVILVAGLSDTAIGKLEITWPFSSLPVGL